MTDAVRQSRRLGIIGSAVGLLALLVSALTYLLPAALLDQPIYPVTDVAGRKATPDDTYLPMKRSRDLVTWEVLPPVTAPMGFGQMEVPQLVAAVHHDFERFARLPSRTGVSGNSERHLSNRHAHIRGCDRRSHARRRRRRSCRL